MKSHDRSPLPCPFLHQKQLYVLQHRRIQRLNNWHSRYDCSDTDEATLLFYDADVHHEWVTAPRQHCDVVASLCHCQMQRSKFNIFMTTVKSLQSRRISTSQRSDVDHCRRVFHSPRVTFKMLQLHPEMRYWALERNDASPWSSCPNDHFLPSFSVWKKGQMNGMMYWRHIVDKYEAYDSGPLSGLTAKIHLFRGILTLSGICSILYTVLTK